MSEEVKMALDEAADSMSKTITHLENELNKVRAGKASPVMLDGVRVDYYGTMTPLKNVANVTTPDARTLNVQPWEKGMLTAISKWTHSTDMLPAQHLMHRHIPRSVTLPEDATTKVIACVHSPSAKQARQLHHLLAELQSRINLLAVVALDQMSHD